MGHAEASSDLDSVAGRIRAYLAAFSTGEPAKVAQHVHTDFQNIHYGYLGEGCSGKTAYLKRLEAFLDEFSRIKYTIVDLLVEGQSAACKYVFSFDMNGRRFDIKGIMWFECADRLILRRTDCWDGLEFLKQTDADAAEIRLLIEAGIAVSHDADIG